MPYFDEKIVKKVGERVWIEPNFTCEFGKNYSIILSCLNI